MEDGVIMTVILRSNHIFDTNTKTTFPGFIQVKDGMIEKVGDLSDLPTTGEITRL